MGFVTYRRISSRMLDEFYSQLRAMLEHFFIYTAGYAVNFNIRIFLRIYTSQQREIRLHDISSGSGAFNQTE